MFILVNQQFFLSFTFSVLGSSPHCNATANRTPAYSTVSLETGDKSILTTGSLGQLLQDRSSPPQNGPTPPLVTQLQPPMLPPPPYPSFKLVQSSTEILPTDKPLLITERKLPKTLFVKSALTITSLDSSARERQTRLTLPQQLLWGGVVSDSVGPNTSALPLASVITKSEKLLPQFPPKHSLTQTFDFLKSESQNANISDIQPVTPSHLQSLTKREFPESASVSDQASRTKLGGASQDADWKSQRLDPEQSSTPSSFTKFDLELSSGRYDQTIKSPVDSASVVPPSPALPLTTAPPTTQPQDSQLQLPTPWTQTESFQAHDSNPPTHQPSSSSIYPSSQTSDSSSKPLLIPDFHQANISNQIQLNTSKQTNSVELTKVVNDTEVTEWLKKNTSQSPMTSNDPRWEKHFEVLFLFRKCLNYKCQ